MRPTNTFGTAFRGSRNNFDALRLAAALAVLFGHSFVLTAGVQNAGTMDPLSRFLARYAAFGEATQEFAVDLLPAGWYGGTINLVAGTQMGNPG